MVGVYAKNPLPQVSTLPLPLFFGPLQKGFRCLDDAFSTERNFRYTVNWKCTEEKTCVVVSGANYFESSKAQQ